MKFLIDECLSTSLVSIAQQAGYEAQHVVHIGKAGWKDWNVANYAHDGDFIVVTNNGSDFKKLYAVQPLHAGLIILLPAVDRVIQKQLFEAVVQKLASAGEPVNQVVEVNLGEQGIAISFYDLPAAP